MENYANQNCKLDSKYNASWKQVKYQSLCSWLMLSLIMSMTQKFLKHLKILWNYRGSTIMDPFLSLGKVFLCYCMSMQIKVKKINYTYLYCKVAAILPFATVLLPNYPMLFLKKFVFFLHMPIHDHALQQSFSATSRPEEGETMKPCKPKLILIKLCLESRQHLPKYFSITTEG